jgi:hypothetical protein
MKVGTSIFMPIKKPVKLLEKKRAWEFKELRKKI